MTVSYDLVLRNGTLVSHRGIGPGDVGIREGRIVALGDLGKAAAAEVMDLKGLHVLPGVIDTQVHFREPGSEHKEDLESGSRGAVLGGVTAVFEMPNTNPSTSTAEALQHKLDRAKDRMWCDHAFYVGACAENADQLGELERLPGCCGVKIFLGSSTGSLLVEDDATLVRVLSNIRRRCAVHCEDEPRLRERQALAVEEGHPRAHPLWRDEETALRATQRLIAAARRTRHRVHVLHVTTAQEMQFLAGCRDVASVETTPQHLTLAAPECYEELGTKAQMNPPIRAAGHRDALWQAVRDGVVDVLGSDHAPHTLQEKARPYPTSPSGMTGVQTLVPIMLDHVNAGRLGLQLFSDLMSASPARLFGIHRKGRVALGYDADFTVVDMGQEREVRDEWIASRSGWTPFAGRKLRGWPRATIVRGKVVMREGELMGPAQGRPLEFEETRKRAEAGA